MNPTQKDIEDCFRKAGLWPVARVNIMGEDVFVADGFIDADKQTYLRRFNVDQGEYPNGCYMTAWLCEDRGGWRVGIEFTPGLTDGAMRVRNIIAKAQQEIRRRKLRRLNG